MFDCIDDNTILDVYPSIAQIGKEKVSRKALGSCYDQLQEPFLASFSDLKSCVKSAHSSHTEHV